MRIESNFRQTTKAAFAFVFTTATYLLARTTGFLPSWFSGEQAEVIPDQVWERGDIHTMAGQRRLLQQQSSGVIVANPIPDQVIDTARQYDYSLNAVFSGNYSLLAAVGTGNSSLPSWLSVQPKLLSIFPSGAGGLATKVAINGSLAYVADGPVGVQILDVKNPSKPQLLSIFPIGSGGANEVVINGSTAFVAGNVAGLQILDVSNTSNPKLLSTYPAGSGYAFGVAISGNTAFVADFSEGLQIIDISNTSHPRLLSTFTPGLAWSVVISGNIAFVAAGDVGLQILNVSDTRNPQLLSTFTSAGYAQEVAISGKTAFVTDGLNLQIIDVSNLRSPKLLSTYPAGAGYVQIAISGSTLFLANGYAGLHILDVSNTSNPCLLATYPAGTNGYTAGVAIKDTTVFVADSSVGLQILDVRQASLVGVPPILELGQQIAITVSARNMDHALAHDHFILTLDQLPRVVTSTVSDQSLYPGQIMTLYLSSELLFVNPGSSFLKLDVKLSTGAAAPAWVNLNVQPILLASFLAGNGGGAGIAINQSTVFVAGGDALYIIDVSQLNNPRLLSNYSIGTGYVKVAVSGNSVFAIDYTGLKIINVSNASSPQLISTWGIADGYAGGVAVKDSTAFLACYSNVQILNVSNLSTLQLLSTYPMSFARTVAVSGNTAFVADGYAGMKILDVSNTRNPRLLFNYSTNFTGMIANGRHVEGVTVSGNTAFLAESDAGLQILDVSNTSNPRLLGEYPAGAGAVYKTVISGSVVFMADANAGLQIFDSSNTSNPRLIGSYPGETEKSIDDLAIRGNTVFLAAKGSVSQTTRLLILDISQWQLTATPSLSDAGNYHLQLTATDELGGTASTQPFTIRVEGPPQITGVIPTQYARVEQFFNYFTPEGLFVDPNFDPISFTATLADGTVLPSWLAFNGISAAFVGTPSAMGNITVLLSATDNIAGSVNTTFNIITSHLPVADLPIATQIASIGIPFYFKTPSTAFFDQDGDPLTYAAQRAGGQPLPTWLRFNASISSFSGLPNGTDGGQYELQILATDPYNGQASTTFTLLVEHFPVVNQTIPSQSVRVSELLNFALSPDAFSDADGNLLSYRARRPDGSALPNWLGFNPQTLLFSGQPAKSDLGVLIVQVTASDPYSASASQNFNITVLDVPTLGTHISRQLLNVGTAAQFRVPANAFNYQGSAPLRYAAYQQLNQTLPGWLQFNNASLIFFGAPQSNDTGIYSLSVIAQDNYGHAATNTFDTVVERFPVANQSLVSVTASVGNPMTFTIPDSAFVDPEGDPLTYSARRADGSALSNWLTFESSNRIFSGIPVVTDIGAMMLQVVVTDPQGGKAQQNMTLTILYAPVISTLPPALKPLREERLFNLTLSPQTFSDPGGAPLNYSSTLGDGSPLPSWLTFFPQNLSLFGMPALTDVGTLNIQIIATNPQGSYVSLPLNLVIWNNFRPQVMQTLSNQQATVLNAFQYFAPPDTFSDANEDVLHYSAAQVDGQPLPGWLHFDAQRLGFFGTPKRSDTGDFAARVIPVALIAHDDKSSTATQFNISVQGTSNVALFLQVAIPLLSGLASAYGLYKNRAVLLNAYKPQRYQRLTEEKIGVGDEYEYKLASPVDQVKKVQVVLPHPRKDCLRIFMSPYRPLPGGLDLPVWLDYDTDTNILRSNGPIPSTASPHLIVQVRGKDDVILEQFPLHIARAEAEAKEAKELGDVRMQNSAPALPAIDDEPGVELQSIGGIGYSS